MTVTLNALYYLNAWRDDVDVEGGMAHKEIVKKCRLDFSIASLGRVDALLDVLRITHKPIREEFFDKPANQNLLFFLAFYVGEVFGWALGWQPMCFSNHKSTERPPSNKN